VKLAWETEKWERRWLSPVETVAAPSPSAAQCRAPIVGRGNGAVPTFSVGKIEPRSLSGRSAAQTSRKERGLEALPPRRAAHPTFSLVKTGTHLPPLPFIAKTETPHPGPYPPKGCASKALPPKPQPPDNFRWLVWLVQVVVYI
jgi:hypothetical protein